MASNKPAPEAPSRFNPDFGSDFGTEFGSGSHSGFASDSPFASDSGFGPDYGTASDYGTGGTGAAYGTEPGGDFAGDFGGEFRVNGDGEPERSWDEWNPTEESVRPVRGRHRVAKQRNGLARSSTVLGVGVIAAVGAGGMATAQSKPPVSISLPDSIADKLPDAKSLPGVGALFSAEPEADNTAVAAAAAPLTTAGLTTTEAEQGTADAGEALRARILQQAEQQQDAADAEAKAAQEKEAAEKAAAEAKKQQDAAEAKAAAEKKKAEEEAKAKAEALRLAKLAASYAIPTSSYTITSTFGQAGSMWSSGYHTGLDFAAPTGTPIKAIHGGTIKSAGWSGSYGYRTVLELDDGTELWFCHQSSIGVSVGQQVTTGETIGRVGATGNVTGPHLHLEVHTPSGTGIDPMAWLRDKGLTP
ncbi:MULTISPECIES: M23 family metallopeptidase [unclassified Streptomyces]|uniref:M23 family metallopeptidase n=1 Tax=unclassified Streptomyces TaxID=2593676 RepID=UPI002259CD8F|nr:MULTISPECIES: M23 family metallopeptidase [unclassified Streptomyces]MCX4788177.1 M23 family metallopeptidase [Streptomyces sp. NBC_01221]WSP56443.1 M23 family metallopeptidase [Streptomyces sp. NBC_01241]WSP63723.1 M23 family metallopeptidase [Streptomyces sp. NBC_01240]WSU22840.1 M23 family metallopeptidase [Streptomyces sp. NBC_01108]